MENEQPKSEPVSQPTTKPTAEHLDAPAATRAMTEAHRLALVAKLLDEVKFSPEEEAILDELGI